MKWSRLSVVIPVFNEEGSVASLHQELVSILEKIGIPFEIIFIDDGSRDGTLNVLKRLRPLNIIGFGRNFGQTAALDAGIKAAKGDIIITMDGDGQNDPADIPILLRKLDQGYDVVSGWRWKRLDGVGKHFVSYGARLLRLWIIGDKIHDSGCALKVYKKECLDGLDLYGEIHRFIPALLEWQGFRVAEVKVNHRPRTSGKTKYTFSRTLKGFLDILSVWFWRKYSSRPLHLFGGVGFIIFDLGILMVVTLFILRFLHIISLKDSVWPLTGFFMILVGIQLFVSGLLADVSLKNYYKINQTRPYTVRDVIKNQ